jgi:Na+/proline symporter
MRWLDWVVVIAYLLWIVTSGLRASRRTNEVDGYFRANRSLPWWAVGLSVMATQLSAITLVGTTGKAYADGMKFVQFYFGLPIAMVILSMTVVPFFYRANVYTAYEYLERRFDLKTRTLAAFTFLIQRALSCGIVIAAPSIILSIVLGWDFRLTILVIGLPVIAYTMVGGVQAVTWTDVKQMGVVVCAMAAVVVVLIMGLPVSASQALHVAGAVGRLQAIDTSLDLHQDYTLWSGLLGSLFLMLSYFGCDQSQVQRYLTAKSVNSARHSLLVSAFAKIPLQAGILLTGVLTFCFFLFNKNPMLFNPVYESTVLSSSRAEEYRALEAEYEQKFDAREEAALELAKWGRFRSYEGIGNPAHDPYLTSRALFQSAEADVERVRTKAVTLVREVTGDKSYTDTNYVFPTFILTYLPIGLTGLMIAAILSAAMSASSGELNALATATAIDVYRRHINPTAPDAAFLRFSKLATAFWGLFACVSAYYAANLGSLIDTVNKIGSLFYGSLLGVFILAIGTKRANGHGAFAGLVAGLVAVFFVAFMPETKTISYLWHNVIGAVVCVVVGMAVSVATPRRAV